MNIIIYTRSGCKYCSQVKELMSRSQFEYEERFISTPEQRQKFLTEHAGAKTYPYVIIDGKPIGGLVETAKLFVENKWIKAQNQQ